MLLPAPARCRIAFITSVAQTLSLVVSLFGLQTSEIMQTEWKFQLAECWKTKYYCSLGGRQSSGNGDLGSLPHPQLTHYLSACASTCVPCCVGQSGGGGTGGVGGGAGGGGAGSGGGSGPSSGGNPRNLAFLFAALLAGLLALHSRGECYLLLSHSENMEACSAGFLSLIVIGSRNDHSFRRRSECEALTSCAHYCPQKPSCVQLAGLWGTRRRAALHL